MSNLLLLEPTLSDAAQDAYYVNNESPSAPVTSILAGAWNNVEALHAYTGPMEVFGAEGDQVIPVAHARRLAASRSQAQFHLIPGGHNDWSQQAEVRIRNP